jgi:type II secretory pathway component PulF
MANVEDIPLWWPWLLPLTVTLLSIGLSLTGLLAVPRFEELFASFGSKFSANTVLAIRISKWLWLATIIALYLLEYVLKVF